MQVLINSKCVSVCFFSRSFFIEIGFHFFWIIYRRLIETSKLIACSESPLGVIIFQFRQFEILTSRLWMPPNKWIRSRPISETNFEKCTFVRFADAKGSHVMWGAVDIQGHSSLCCYRCTQRFNFHSTWVQVSVNNLIQVLWTAFFRCYWRSVFCIFYKNWKQNFRSFKTISVF